MSLKAGDSFPQDVTFSYVLLKNFPYPAIIPPPFTPSAISIPHEQRQTNTSFNSYIPWSEESSEITSCGIPINYFASKEWADKKVILFALPGSSPLLPVSVYFRTLFHQGSRLLTATLSSIQVPSPPSALPTTSPSTSRSSPRSAPRVSTSSLSWPTTMPTS